MRILDDHSPTYGYPLELRDSRYGPKALTLTKIFALALGRVFDLRGNYHVDGRFRFSCDNGAAGQLATLAQEQGVEREPDDRLGADGRRADSSDCAGQVTSHDRQIAFVEWRC